MTQPSRRLGLGAGVCCLALVLGCSDGSFIPSDGKLPLGTWGGDGAAVIATDSVTHVHVGCTYGDVLGRVSVDEDGRFAVDGSYMLHAFPVPRGPLVPAQFVGRLVGKVLTFAVAVNDTTVGKVVGLGPVTVVLGREPEMGQCPICLAPKLPN